jgi:hypothetical protein
LNKRLIFSLNSGRCGTGYLAEVMNTVPGVYALHEPYPNFVSILRPGKGDHDIYKKWMQDKKLPFIEGLGECIYLETSHLFIKGFVKPMLELGVVPDVIVIHRNRRDIALSLFRVATIPGRTGLGKRYCVQPDDKNILLPHDNYSHWTDYMLCYWYALETEARIKLYSQMIRDYGGLAVDVNMDDMVTQSGFLNMLSALGLPPPDMEQYNKIKDKRVNGTEEYMRGYWPPGDMFGQERELEEKYDLETAKS